MNNAIKYKIVFDRSIFHGNNFLKIKESNLYNCVKKKTVRIYFTTTFWEETLKYERTSWDKLREQLNFLHSVDTNKWFKELKYIIDDELNNKWSEHDYYLFSRQAIKDKRKDFINIAEGNISTQQAWKDNEKIIQNKKSLKKLRKLERNNPQIKMKNFNEFFENEIGLFIEELIVHNHSNPKVLLDNWKRNRNKCKLTEHYARAFLCMKYLAKFDHQLKIDENDRVDAEQLSFLFWADIMVSNDTKFMKKAFNLLYGSSVKKLLTLDEFLNFLRKI